MNDLADPPDLTDPEIRLNALEDAGADMAQALQDIVDGDPMHDMEHLQTLIDAWEVAYKRSLA
jgi:hypothetical protein